MRSAGRVVQRSDIGERESGAEIREKVVQRSEKARRSRELGTEEAERKEGWRQRNFNSGSTAVEGRRKESISSIKGPYRSTIQQTLIFSIVNSLGN